MSLQQEVDNAVAEAFEAIGDLAGTYTLIQDQSVFDPVTSTKSVLPVIETSCKGVVDEEKSVYVDADSETKGFLVIYIRIKHDTEIKIGDKLRDFENKVSNIVQVKKIKSNTITFIYELKVIE